MKHAWVITVLASVVAVLAITGLTLAWRSAHATPARPSLSPVQTVVFDCPGQQAMIRPKTFILTCADGNALFDKLSWSSWTPGLASATGSLVLNDCTPFCADGHFHSYPAVVVFWGSKAVKNHPGEHCYTMMTEILTGPRPRYYDYIHSQVGDRAGDPDQPAGDLADRAVARSLGLTSVSTLSS